MKRIAIVLGLLLGACGDSNDAGATCLEIDQEIYEACGDQSDPDFGDCRSDFLDTKYPAGDDPRRPDARWTEEAEIAWWMQIHCQDPDSFACAEYTAICEDFS